MFKNLIILSLLSITIILPSPSYSIPVNVSTYCLANCFQCTQNPLKCPYIQSIPFPNHNHNCLPYSLGKQCQLPAQGYQNIIRDGLSGWQSGQSIPTTQTCTLFHQPPTTPKFQSLGPMQSGTNLTRTITINRDIIDIIILKFSFTLNSTSIFRNQTQTTSIGTPPTPSDTVDQPNVNPDGTVDTVTEQGQTGTATRNTVQNRTNRVFVDVRLRGNGVDILLQLYYPTQPKDITKIVNSTCGTNVQYVYAYNVPQSVQSITNNTYDISIQSIGGSGTTWGLNKFQLYIGCGGFMIPTSSTLKCNACAGGFYPIRVQQNVLSGCGLCDNTCRTCIQDRCTLCQANTQLNQANGKCQYTKNYINISTYKIIQGRAIQNQVNSKYLYNIISIQDISNSNSIVLETELRSPAPYSLRFYFIYNNQFIQSLQGRSVIISSNTRDILTIPSQQFRTQAGYYDTRLQSGIRKHYIKNIYIDMLNQDNIQKNIRVSIRAPQGSQGLYVSNYQVIQYQCANRCAQCDRINNVCLQCYGFFVNRGVMACVVCPNGFYLRKYLGNIGAGGGVNNNNTTNNTNRNTNTNTNINPYNQTDDMCIKCHSTCKQCIGPQINQCSDCYSQFQLSSISYNNLCIRCTYNSYKNRQQSIPSQCLQCLAIYPYQYIFTSTACSACIKDRQFQDIMVGQLCRVCWISNGLASSRCVPTPVSGLTFYGSDIENGVVDQKSWKVVSGGAGTGAGGALQRYTCTNDYKDLYGIPPTSSSSPSTSPSTSPSSSNTTIQYTQSQLPKHTGLYIVLNIFKIDLQSSMSNSGQRTSQYIYIDTGDNNRKIVQLTNRKQGSIIDPGTNICSNNNKNQIIHTFTYSAPKHTANTFVMSITSQGGGIYVRQVQMYLGNCDQCINNQLNYQIKYMPRYSYNNSVSSGIDIWIEFNKNIKKGNNGMGGGGNMSSNDLKNAFKFAIDKLPNTNIQNIQFQDQLQLNNRLHYYVPLDQSFINGTLNVKANPDSRIYGVNTNTNTNTAVKSSRNGRNIFNFNKNMYDQYHNNNQHTDTYTQNTDIDNPLTQNNRRLLINSPLNILLSQQLINRYTRLSSDDLVSTTQIYWFFRFFQWFALIVMIICAFFGIGVIFQQFSIMLQLLFLHVYISSHLLPATFKAPIVGMQRMQNLNYFADPHAQQIQYQWFKDYIHPSPYVFQQYNKDILFERSYYPTIIINLIYLCWFIVLYVLYKRVSCFQTNKSNVVGFLRNIPARPLNYADQIWRYQFITTMWAAFMQFHVLKNDTHWERLNLALCFISFIISILWPFFVVCYTYRLNKIKYSTQFMYKYQDIYFKKMQTISQQKIKYYNYVFIRFARYLIMVLFICVFTGHQIIAPVILICVNVIQIVYVVAMKIFYNSNLGTFFKVIQNLLFIAIEVALLFVYGLSDNAKEQDFLNLGYAIIVLYVIMIILGVLRFIYYAYQKIKNFKYNMKFGIDNGQVVKVGPTPLPNTDRFDAPVVPQF